MMRGDYIAIDWRVLVSVLAAAVCVTVMLGNKWIARREFGNLRGVIFGVVAFLTAAPYIILTITAGWINLVYFILVWGAFLLVMGRVRVETFFVPPIIGGVMLALPASQFIYADRGGVIFLRGGFEGESASMLIVRVAYFVLLMVAAYLTIKKDGR